ncbi:hypothetical protein [Kitasatospora sp. HPMI-4]|uniref:hypothetical protein n=1 Tax=Kitasatospora sp. HPMI-4 TaxID=3448443 RepID=UPI003F1AC596
MSQSDPGQPLLDYAVISDPFPLYARAASNTPPTALHIVVSNGGGETVYCREILFSLPVGTLAQSLLSVDAGDGQAQDWTVTHLQGDSTQMALPAGDYANFSAKPTKGDAAVDVSGVTITLENLTISDLPGTARIEIRETATTDQGSWPVSPRFTKLALAKFPAPAIPAQAVIDFHADRLEVAAGDTVNLSWRGPTTLDYKIAYGDGKPQDVGNDLTWSGRIDRDTTFELSYTIGTATHFLTTTVAVKNPKLTGVEVDGDLAVTGSTDLQDVTAHEAFTTKKTLTVEGHLDATATATVGDSLEAKKGLQVDGDLTAQQALTVGGNLTVTGDATIKKDLEVGSAWVSPYKISTSGGSAVKFAEGIEVTGASGITIGGKGVVVRGEAHRLIYTGKHGDGKLQNINYIGDSIYMADNGAAAFYFE